MNHLPKILELLNYTVEQFENIMLQDWLRWCEEKSLVVQEQPKSKELTALLLRLSIPDLQSLVADTALFNYFEKQYVDCMIDFMEDTEGMNPEPNIVESRAMFNKNKLQLYRLFSMPLIQKARTKKIVNHVRS